MVVEGEVIAEYAASGIVAVRTKCERQGSPGDDVDSSVLDGLPVGGTDLLGYLLEVFSGALVSPVRLDSLLDLSLGALWISSRNDKKVV
jgi:hypothetical protein